MAADRDRYDEVGAAMRQAIERALAKRYSVGKMRLLAAIIHDVSSWSRLTDTRTKTSLAKTAGLSAETTRELLRSMASDGVIVYQPGHGARRSVVGLPESPDAAGVQAVGGSPGSGRERSPDEGGGRSPGSGRETNEKDFPRINNEKRALPLRCCAPVAGADAPNGPDGPCISLKFANERQLREHLHNRHWLDDQQIEAALQPAGARPLRCCAPPPEGPCGLPFRSERLLREHLRYVHLLDDGQIEAALRSRLTLIEGAA
jgi:hypothetical protein